MALSAFFAFGFAMASLAAIALVTPGEAWAPLWQLNPQARDALHPLGIWAILLMVAVAAACGLAATGLWIRASWGRGLAVGVLIANLIGDVANTVVRGDFRSLIGIPIAGALIAFLLSSHVRRQFHSAQTVPFDT